ncbi:MAG: serine/threonine protein kinase [Gammaproteobacteria bacterium]|nr:serine/threonine protein kinase [Gammaproteobacteria bacterium]
MADDDRNVSGADQRPFDGLEPSVVLDAVETLGVACSGRLLALNSFENRVYQLGLEDGRSVVAKFYRPARWSDATIREEHAFAIELARNEVEVVAPMADREGETLLEHAGFRFAVYPSVGGYWPELNHAEDRRQLGRLLGRMHAVSALHGFQHRPALDVQSFGYRAVETVQRSGLLAVGLESRYAEVTANLLQRIERRYADIGPMRQLRLHGDLHRGNILWSERGVALVDLDDCRMGPAIQDLWMLLDGDAEQMREQLFDIAEGYETFFELDWREIALIEALRGLRLMHHAAWLAHRWTDPAFPKAFPWFGTENYWVSHTHDLSEQIDKLDLSASGLSAGLH